MEAKTFRIRGRVIDQYGNPVKGFPMQLDPFFEAHPASWQRRKTKEFKTRTNEKGEFVLDTSPIKITGTFYGCGKGSPVVVDGEYYELLMCGGSDIFSLYNGQWIRDARWELPQPVPHDENKEYIYRVAHMGQPQRMISFHSRPKVEWGKNPPNDLWVSLDVLKGELKEGRCEECDLSIHITGLKDSFLGSDSYKPCEVAPIFEFYAQKGGGVQFQKVSMFVGCEAPEEGYQSYIKGQAKKTEKDLWEAPWRNDDYCNQSSPTRPVVYFYSRNKQVYGGFEFECGADEFRIRDGYANPRGERSLNGGGLPLPVTLPFKEDVPFVDRKKIWAYEDPEKENTIIVEGEKGAVEKGAWVSVFNNTASDERVDRHATTIKGINIDVRYVPIGDDGTFKVSLYGREENVISVYVAWPYGVNPQTGHQGERGEGIVQLAPRWRLKEKK